MIIHQIVIVFVILIISSTTPSSRVKELFSQFGSFSHRGIVHFELGQGDARIVESTLALLLAVEVADIVARPIGPIINSTAVLFTHLPDALVPFAVRIVQDSFSVTVVIFEFSFENLSIWPQKGALTIFVPILERSEEKSTVWPLEQPLSIHGVIREGSLVDFAARGYSPTKSIYLTLLEEPFKNGIVWVDLETHTVRF